MPRGIYKRTKKCNEAHKRPLRFCSIERCNGKHKAKGLCKKCYYKQYRKGNKKKAITYGKQWQKDNKEYCTEKKKQYRQTPTGRASSKAIDHNRRALEKGLTLATVQRVYDDNRKKYGVLTCVLCFKPINFGNDSLEHLTPVSRGGNNDYDNLGVAHQSCNSQKHTMTLEEWVNKKVSNTLIQTSPALETKTKR